MSAGVKWQEQEMNETYSLNVIDIEMQTFLSRFSEVCADKICKEAGDSNI